MIEDKPTTSTVPSKPISDMTGGVPTNEKPCSSTRLSAVPPKMKHVGFVIVTYPPKKKTTKVSLSLMDKEENSIVDVVHPVVVFLGTELSQKEIVTLYTPIGFTFLSCSFTTPTPPWGGSYNEDKTRVIQMLKWFTENKKFDVPVIVHMCGGGGVSLYEHLLKLLHENDIKLNIYGLILESAPSSGHVMCQLHTTTYGMNFLLKTLCTASLFLIFVLHQLLAHMPILSTLLNIRRYSSWLKHHHNNNLRIIGNNIPQLYLFGRKDTTCDPEYIQHFVSTQQKNGGQVYSRCWDTGHEELFHENPQEYTDMLYLFLEKIKIKKK